MLWIKINCEMKTIENLQLDSHYTISLIIMKKKWSVTKGVAIFIENENPLKEWNNRAIII